MAEPAGSDQTLLKIYISVEHPTQPSWSLFIWRITSPKGASKGLLPECLVKMVASRHVYLACVVMSGL